jgi:hypothetical protein
VSSILHFSCSILGTALTLFNLTFPIGWLTDPQIEIAMGHMVPLMG